MCEMKKGLFFAFEGIDGSGKSTQIKYLMERLREHGLRCHETREPSEGPVGTMVRQILTGRMKADGRVISGLFAADRLDHLTNEVNGLCKEIDRGITVVTDRYYFSSYAYNGVDMDMNWVMECNRFSAELLRPTLNIFLDIPVDTALERISKNRLHTELYEKEERLLAVRKNYFKAFELTKDTERVAVIDANAAPEVVARRVWEAVKPYID